MGRRAAPQTALPSGQYVTEDFPVLSAGPTPHVPLDQWEFTIDDGKNVLRRWTWRAFRELPSEHITADIHCVTSWSKLDTVWEGVSLYTQLDGMSDDASFALVRYFGGYTTNLPVEDLLDGQAWVAFNFDGEDLVPDTGVLPA
jgi:DMSO/TMAO reductase YedYZ molybdopterin-dependent catalytic subunit